jgi:hypothetical protein
MYCKRKFASDNNWTCCRARRWSRQTCSCRTLKVHHHRPAGAIPSATATMSLGKGPHCSFVLLAEFDIDSGAQLTYQFPQPLGTDEG